VPNNAVIQCRYKRDTVGRTSQRVHDPRLQPERQTPARSFHEHRPRRAAVRVGLTPLSFAGLNRAINVAFQRGAPVSLIAHQLTRAPSAAKRW